MSTLRTSATFESTDVGVAIHSISAGMVEAAAANGWIDRERAIDEVIVSIR